jgi:predicted PurR-regulated permease PerM
VAGLLVGLAILNLAVLWGLLPTIFFAITVTYFLVPLTSLLRLPGYSRYVAGVISAIVAAPGALLLVAPLFGRLYLRRQRIINGRGLLPNEILQEFGESSDFIDTNQLIRSATSYLTQLAFDIAASLPVLAGKGFGFVFVVFGLLIRREELSAAILSPIPDAYHGIVWHLHGRSRQTLYALYITQVATGLATSLIALPVFLFFGYKSAFTLALIAGILQFLPVIGPSILELALVAFEVRRGASLTGAILVVVGLVLIGFLPDAIIRPRLARQSAHLPGTLYYVGFIGGVLSLGAVGVSPGHSPLPYLPEPSDCWARRNLRTQSWPSGNRSERLPSLVYRGTTPPGAGTFCAQSPQRSVHHESRTGVGGRTGVQQFDR